MILQVILAFVGTVAFSVLFGAPPRHFLYCGLTGAFGWWVYLVGMQLNGSHIVSTFAATFLFTSLSRWFSTIRRTPTIVFLICGIFALVPGAAIYSTAYYLFAGQDFLVLQSGGLALKLAVSIALGISFAYALPSRLFGWKQSSRL